MNEPISLAVIEMRAATVGAMRDASLIILEDVNWSIAPGEFWVVAGQEHAGKSDLLMLAAGLMAPVAGSCKLFGSETRDFGEAELPERLRVGFVFQGGQLFNQLTIAENVALPLRYQKNLTAAETARPVELLLELLELKPFANSTPLNVPANWRRRAALGRALILKPEVLLLDNPQAGLAARHLQWWLRFLDQLGRGHEHFGGAPMTIVATADDLRPWKTGPRQFAFLRDKKFIPLGNWTTVESAGDPVVQELLTAAAGIT
jgi:ABC-type transporter Mla maintaining outer membrane lipid asymmetry ATPase subunit MlaF